MSAADDEIMLNEELLVYIQEHSNEKKATAEFDAASVIKPLESLKVRIRLFNQKLDPRHLFIKHLPKDWSTDNYRRSIYMDHQRPEVEVFEITINTGSKAKHINKVIVEITGNARAITGLISITIVGQFVCCRI